MKTRILSKYDWKYRSWTRNSYSDTEFGFDGQYTHKDLGVVDVMLTQDGREQYHLMFDITRKGIEYQRTLELNHKCTHRFAGLKAKEFLEQLTKKTQNE